MNQKTTGDLIGELHAIQTELANRHAHVLVKISAHYGVDTIKLVREATGLSLSDAMKAVHDAVESEEGIEIYLDVKAALLLPELEALGHSYAILP